MKESAGKLGRRVNVLTKILPITMYKKPTRNTFLQPFCIENFRNKGFSRIIFYSPIFFSNYINILYQRVYVGD